ncbi:MAG: Hsp33 family molecular chaperone HslO [Clostridiaceae bacterium]|jgi:molecular chaperone Hsp33|nr:Hsp33 family molecular chaperone HslO [Bacillota bacterium]NLN51771.1 Hsp33 family molecular chaperone HslO [Clostridiaceae bacterium]
MTNNNIDHRKDDYLVQATAKQGLLRCLAVRTTKLVDYARETHDLSPATTVALGRLMSGALLMAADLKSDQDQITLITKSDGDISNLSAIATLDGKVRGYGNQPQAPSYYHEPGKLDIAKSVGKGNLTVIKDLGLKDPYIGNVELVSGEIAEDLASYYFYSEQIPTVLFLGVRLDQEGVVSAGGMLVQVLPGADEEILTWLENRAVGFPDLSELIEQGISPHQLIDLLLGEADIEYLKEYPVTYYCPCNRDRMTSNLALLGAAELKEMAADPEGIELQCHYCSNKYQYQQSEIQDLYNAVKTAEKDFNKPDINLMDFD